MASPNLAIRIAADVSELKKNLEEGRGAIEALGPSVEKLQSTWKGSSDKLIQSANNITAAVTEVGTSTMTAGQAASSLKTLEQAMAQLERTGQAVPPQMREIAAELKNINAPAETLTSGLKDHVAGYVAGMVTFEAFKAAGSKVINFFKESVAGAQEAENAHRRLTVAMENQGSASPALIKQYDELAKGTQKITTFSDTAVKELQVMLVQVGNVLPSQMGVAVKATTDLASAMGIDLAQAGTVMAKAAEGNTAALGKMGVQLDETRVKSEGLEYVAAQIEKRFGGQAQAELDTYSGKMKQIEHQYESTKEAVGRLILETGLLQNAMSQLSTGSNLLSSILEGDKQAFGRLILEMSKGVIPAEQYNKIIELLNKSLEEQEQKIKAAGSQYATAAQHAENAVLARKAEQAALDTKAETDKKAAEAALKHADAVKELASFSVNYRDTLATLNSATVEEVQGYLAAGASANLLQEVYKLTEGQIKAITMARQADIDVSKRQSQANEELVRADQQALQAATKLWAEYHSIKAGTSATAIDRQIEDIHRWEKEQAAAFEASKSRQQMNASSVADFYAALSTDVTVKLQRVGIDQAALTDAATNHSKAGLQQIADAARRTYDEALAQVGVWSDGTIEKFRETWEAAQQAANEFGVGAAPAIDTVRDKVNELTGSIMRSTAAMDPLRATFLSMAASGQLASGYSIDYASGLWGSFSLGAPFSLGGRASGGPVTAGEPYMVGERGPEIIVPQSSGTVLPNGVGSVGQTFNISVPIHVQGSVVGNSAEMARLVENAVRDAVKNTGGRF